LDPENECADDPAAIVNGRSNLSSGGCYIRTVTAGVELRKKFWL
jgi:hypothetical protein